MKTYAKLYRAARAVIRLKIAEKRLALNGWHDRRAGVTEETDRFNELNDAVGWALADVDLPACWQDPVEMATCPVCGHHTHYLNGTPVYPDRLGTVFTCPDCDTETPLHEVVEFVEPTVA